MRCPNLLREPAFSRLVLFPWCVGAGDVMCRGAGRDVMWLSQNKYMLSIQKYFFNPTLYTHIISQNETHHFVFTSLAAAHLWDFGIPCEK